MADNSLSAYRPLHPIELPLLADAGVLLVVHYWASWNLSDRLFTPALRAVRQRFQGQAVFRGANVDQLEITPLLEQKRITNVPALEFVVGPQVRETLIGIQPEQELRLRIGVALRDVPALILPEWRTTEVVALARGILLDEAFDRLPLLADALMDAGCGEPAILDPCQTSPWAVWVAELLAHPA